MVKKRLTLEQVFGNDAYFLESKGFDVVCVDKSENSRKIIQEKDPKIKVITTKFEDLKIEEKYDLIYSNFGIIFCDKNKIDKLITMIKNSIEKNGFFVGNFLGKDDEWNDSEHSYMKFFEENEILNYFSEYKIWSISNQKYIKDASNQKEKKWHIIEIFAQKI